MNGITLISFMADWCGACKAQDPILEELDRIIGDKIEIIKVNVSENRDMIKDLNIHATPTLFILKGDNIFKKYVGLTDRNELESAINGALKST